MGADVCVSCVEMERTNEFVSSKKFIPVEMNSRNKENKYVKDRFRDMPTNDEGNKHITE